MRYYESHIKFLENGGEESKLYYFKKKNLLRVDHVVGMMKGMYGYNHSVLDIGSQRGSFLWSFLEAFPNSNINSIDLDPKYVDIHNKVIGDKAHLGDVTNLPFDDCSFEYITCLEVLEHLTDPDAAVRELIRVATDYVIFSVPSKPDDNPEHLTLFTERSLKDLFSKYDRHIKFNNIHNHFVGIVKL